MPHVGAQGRYILQGEVDDGPTEWRHAAGGLTAYVEAEPATFVESDAEADEAAIIEADGDLLAGALESDDDPQRGPGVCSAGSPSSKNSWL